MTKVSIHNGKYTFQIDPVKECDVTVLRYDEPWLVIKQGSGAVMSMMYELIELRAQNKRLKKEQAANAWLP